MCMYTLQVFFFYLFTGTIHYIQYLYDVLRRNGAKKKYYKILGPNAKLVREIPTSRGRGRNQLARTRRCLCTQMSEEHEFGTIYFRSLALLYVPVFLYLLLFVYTSKVIWIYDEWKGDSWYIKCNFVTTSLKYIYKKLLHC